MVEQKVFCRTWMISLVLVVWSTGAFREASAQSVVVYSALDQEFAEPVLKAYAKSNGVRVLPKFDVESTKTVGLTNLIIAEAGRPRCDLFWNDDLTVSEPE